jgi:exosortase E/protease (VPEID-CTERM system)
MSADGVSPCGNPVRRDDTPLAPSLPLFRWVCLLALLLAEVLALTLRFDTRLLDEKRYWWAHLLSHSSEVFRLGCLIALATLVFGWSRLRGEWQRAFESSEVPATWWPALLGHLGAMAVFTALTAFILEWGIESSPFAAAWALAWVLTGCLTLGLWVAAVVPVSLWLPLARRGVVPLAGGVVVGSAAWAAGCWATDLWQPLSRLTFWTVGKLLGLVSADVVCQPDDFILGTASFQVHIAPSCSGYEGIGLTLAFLGAYLWAFRADLRFPQALCLLPIGAVLIWLANAVRIAALVLIGTWGSREVALGGFHSQAGWLAFLGVGLGLVVVSRRMRFFSRSLAAGHDANPAVPYLVPVLTLLATAMITGAFCHGFDWLYPLRVLTVGCVLWCCRRAYASWSWGWSWSAVGVGVLVFVIWMALEPRPADSEATGALASGLAGLPGGWAVVWLVFRVFGSVVTVPLAEELAFRGYLSRRLMGADFESIPLGKFTWFSFVVSSVAFGALHNRWLAGTIAGMLYAVILSRRGRLWDAVLAHTTTNALIAAYVLTTGSWSLWS